jgi:hypothetical protein
LVGGDDDALGFPDCLLMLFTCACISFIDAEICANTVEYFDETMEWKRCGMERWSLSLT